MSAQPSPHTAARGQEGGRERAIIKMRTGAPPVSYAFFLRVPPPPLLLVITERLSAALHTRPVDDNITIPNNNLDALEKHHNVGF